MNLNRVIRYMADNSSITGDLLATSLGTVAGEVEATTIYVPCALRAPKTLFITPLDTDSKAMLASFHANDLALTAKADVVTATSAWAGTTAYTVGDIRKNDGNLYICVNAHTSGSTFDDANWEELKVENYLKLTVAPAATDKKYTFNVQINGLVP